MLWILMITAVFAAGIATAICYALNWTRTIVVAGAQFVAAFAASYLTATFAARTEFGGNILLISLTVAAFFALFFLLLRVFFGPLESSEGGSFDRKWAEEDKHQKPRRQRTT